MPLQNKYEIAPVAPADDTALGHIIRNCLAEYSANKPGTVYYEESTDHLSELFAATRAAYFVLHESGKVSGGAGIFPTDGLPTDTCELAKMYLSPGARKKGYAHKLLDKCIARARELGYKTMYLETLSELTDAISFYEKMGFTFLKHPIGNSGHTGCDVWMVRSI